MQIQRSIMPVKTPAGKKNSNVITHIKNNKSLYLLLVPGILYYIIFSYMPMFGITIAFKDFDMFGGIFNSQWVGLKHFKELFSSETFYEVFRNSILINIYKIIFNFPVPVILAISLNEIRNKSFKKITQTVVYLPHFLSWVVISGLVINFLSPTNGVVNILIKSLGKESISFLTNKAYFRTIIVLSDLWHGMGWSSIVFLAALTSIDASLYEAATIDGAGRFRQILYITLPGIKSTIVVMLLIKIGNIMNNGFEQIFLLYNPLVYDVADVFETYVYRIGLIDARYDFSTAVGLFKSVVGFLMLLSANTLSRRLGEKGIY